MSGSLTIDKIILDSIFGGCTNPRFEVVTSVVVFRPTKPFVIKRMVVPSKISDWSISHPKSFNVRSVRTVLSLGVTRSSRTWIGYLLEILSTKTVHTDCFAFVYQLAPNNHSLAIEELPESR